MTRSARGPMILLLLAPLLLGAVASGERVALKDVAGVQSAQKAAPEVQSQPKAQPRESRPRSNAMQIPVPTAVSSDSNHAIDWYSINGGGIIDASSPSYRMSASAGQLTAGEASSPSYQMGIGFWYGAGGGCSCPHQGDMNTDGVINVSDVLKEIQIAFVNGTDVQDPECPRTRGDVNNSGAVDVNDVLYIIKTAFVNGPNPVNPCGP